VPTRGRTLTNSLLALLLLTAPASADRLRELLGDVSTAFQGSNIIPFKDVRHPPPAEIRPRSPVDDIIFAPKPMVDVTRTRWADSVKPWGPEPFDWGGLVREYERRVKAATRKEIRGTCISACTMYLAVKDLCVSDDAMFWFHSSYLIGTTLKSDSGNQMLFSHWPVQVQLWALRVKALE
jgi:hypothetical protein